ncbi:type-1 angiotensin II receptor-like [Saccostrea cucullata]|uniref:type-1 angiotensin II receptor-like n=1 Tax=Saccostrea cuccullata TaxID=36930 RepID=UPI002ED5CE68
MASHKRRILGNTSNAAELHSWKFYEEMTQNNISSFWSSVPEKEIIQQMWNETHNLSAEYDYTHGAVSFKFYMFDSYSSKLTSETLHQSFVILGLIIGCLGLVGNVVAIFKILCDEKFHTPTFVVIGCLAFSDLLFIVCMFLYRFSNFSMYISSQSFPVLITMTILRETIFHSSVTHIVLLSVIRYLLIAYPLQSKIRLTPTVILGCSIVVWVFSSLFSALISLPSIEDYIYARVRTMFFIKITYSGLSVCAILTLHILKMKTLKKSSIPSSISRRMNVIIFIILFVFICYQVAYILFQFSIYLVTMSVYYFVYLHDIFFILVTLNYSCNPYILFFASFLCSSSKRNQIKPNKDM